MHYTVTIHKEVNVLVSLALPLSTELKIMTMTIDAPIQKACIQDVDIPFALYT